MPKLKSKKNWMEAKEVEVDIDSINLWDENPYNYKRSVIQKIAKIIEVHGQVTPVIVYTKDNMIRKGNKSFLALKELGKKTIKVKFVNFPSVKFANAYALSDNLSSTWSNLDDKLVNRILTSEPFQGVTNKDIALLTGFDEKELLLFDLESDLDKTNIKGKDCGSNDSVVLIFEDNEDFLFFKETMNMPKRGKSVLYSDLQKRISWRRRKV